jgi:hypothetical protein
MTSDLIDCQSLQRAGESLWSSVKFTLDLQSPQTTLICRQSTFIAFACLYFTHLLVKQLIQMSMQMHQPIDIRPTTPPKHLIHIQTEQARQDVFPKPDLLRFTCHMTREAVQHSSYTCRKTA